MTPTQRTPRPAPRQQLTPRAMGRDSTQEPASHLRPDRYRDVVPSAHSTGAWPCLALSAGSCNRHDTVGQETSPTPGAKGFRAHSLAPSGKGFLKAMEASRRLTRGRPCRSRQLLAVKCKNGGSGTRRRLRYCRLYPTRQEGVHQRRINGLMHPMHRP
jgi:hypothetical protein